MRAAPRIPDEFRLGEKGRLLPAVAAIASQGVKRLLKRKPRPGVPACRSANAEVPTCYTCGERTQEV